MCTVRCCFRSCFMAPLEFYMRHGGWAAQWNNAQILRLNLNWSLFSKPDKESGALTLVLINLSLTLQSESKTRVWFLFFFGVCYSSRWCLQVALCGGFMNSGLPDFIATVEISMLMFPLPNSSQVHNGTNHIRIINLCIYEFLMGFGRAKEDKITCSQQIFFI